MSLVKNPYLAAIVIILAWGSRTSALSFNFTYIDDANGTFASRGWLDPTSLFQQDIRAAANLWGARFASDAAINVQIDTHSYAARAGGTNSSGRLLYTNAAGKKVWEPGPLTRILTGSNPGATTYGYDILLGFDASFVENYYWFDPQPQLRTAQVPANRGDFVSVVMHELGHGFGMTGYRDFPTGQILGSDATLFDDHTYFGGNGNPIAADGSRNSMFFRGTYSASLYGSDLHLTNKPPGDLNYSQNYFHLSSCSGDDGLGLTLMNGCVLPNGTRLPITPFDLGVFADLGYPIVIPTGDYNADGIVDAGDYVVWRNSLSQTGVGLPADGNLDNKIDADDYNYWRSRFGQHVAGGSIAALSNSVPEPHAVLILATFACVNSFRRGPRSFSAKTRDACR
jgi:hypothetical protein